MHVDPVAQQSVPDADRPISVDARHPEPEPCRTSDLLATRLNGPVVTLTQGQRRAAVLDILGSRESATVTELATQLSITEMTIRRDLEALEVQGLLKRFHGGARLTAGSSYEPPLVVRMSTRTAEKRAIAAAVADLVEDGSTVLLDGGSTGIAVAQALVGRDLTVCALSLRVAWVFEGSSTVRLLQPPGTLRRGELSVSGAETVAHLQRHHFDTYVLTASAFSPEGGFTEWNVEDAAVKRAALEGAVMTVAAVDSSKFDRTAFVGVCPMDTPQVVVSDDGLGGSARASAEAVVQRLVLAPVLED